MYRPPKENEYETKFIEKESKTLSYFLDYGRGSHAINGIRLGSPPLFVRIRFTEEKLDSLIHNKWFALEGEWIQASVLIDKCQESYCIPEFLELYAYSFLLKEALGTISSLRSELSWSQSQVSYPPLYQ